MVVLEETARTQAVYDPFPWKHESAQSYHVPTKQLLIEHNFNPYLDKKQVAKASSVLRMMMKTNDFSSCAKEVMPNGPKSKEGCKVHCK